MRRLVALVTRTGGQRYHPMQSLAAAVAGQTAPHLHARTLRFLQRRHAAAVARTGDLQTASRRHESSLALRDRPRCARRRRSRTASKNRAPCGVSSAVPVKHLLPSLA